MATGMQRTVRRALLARLKADAGLTAIVPAASINPAGEPTWPFIILRSPVSRQLKAAQLNGQEGSWDIHAFARDRLSGGVTVETGEDHCGRIGAAIERVLADNRLALEGGLVARISLTDMRLLPDESPDAWHYMAQINWRGLA